MIKDHYNRLPVYRVSFSKSEDFDDIVQFYVQNQNKYIVLRKTEYMQNSVSNGLCILLRDEANRIVGSSFIYAYPYPAILQKQGIQFNELSMTRICVEGYPGLFTILTSIKVLHAYVRTFPEEGFIFGTLSRAFQKRVLREGYHEITDRSQIQNCQHHLLASAGSIVEGAKWFGFDLRNFPRIAKQLVPILDNPVLSNNRGQIGLDFSGIYNHTAVENAIRKIAQMSVEDLDAIKSYVTRLSVTLLEPAELAIC